MTLSHAKEYKPLTFFPWEDPDHIREDCALHHGSVFIAAETITHVENSATSRITLP